MQPMPSREEVVLRYVIETWAEKRPDDLACSFEDGTQWTWRETLEEGYRTANGLAARGVKRGDHVLINMANGPDWVRAWFGVAFLGATMVPINPALRGDLLVHHVRDSLARVAICSGEPAARTREVDGIEVLLPEDVRSDDTSPPELESPIEPWDIHTVNYTSGTTGPSKGVLTTYLHSAIASKENRWDIRSDECMLITSPLFHAGGQVPALAAFLVGARIAVRSAFSGSKFLDVVRETGATHALLVGTMGAVVEALPPQPDDADNPLRVVMAVPMVSDPAAFRERFGLELLIAAFGMSEVGTALVVWNPPAEKRATAGKPRDGMEIRVVDEHDIPVPPGVMGELVLRTDRPWEITPGYLNRPEETARAWRNGWFHTGDAFYVDEDGYFYFADRIKDSLRRRGENISSFEVERAVMQYEGIVEAACVAAPGEYGDDEVKVFVVTDGRELDYVKLVEFLAERMPYFMVPRYIEPIDELPKTPSTRVMKYLLRERGNSDATWDREAAGIVLKRDY